jgi:putative SOS response-associated peptidase YedK
MEGVPTAELLALAPRYNIAPSQKILGFTQTENERSVCLFHWGLIPSWSKEPTGFINARAETLQEKPSFRDSFRDRRCLILADGFYEWGKRNGKAKQPYYIQMKDEMPFAFAGIWDQWRGDGEVITSCAIITTTPNELVAPIHNRMPVILQPDKYHAWLSRSEPEQLRALLVPTPASEMKSFPVGSAVNRPQLDDASLVEPTEELPLVTHPTLF